MRRENTGRGVGPTEEKIPEGRDGHLQAGENTGGRD